MQDLSTLPKVPAKQKAAILNKLKLAREERAEANSVYDAKMVYVDKHEIDFNALEASNGRKFVDVEGERAYLHRSVTPDTEAVQIILMEAREDKTYTIDGRDINVTAGQQKFVAYAA